MKNALGNKFINLFMVTLLLVTSFTQTSFSLAMESDNGSEDSVEVGLDGDSSSLDVDVVIEEPIQLDDGNVEEEKVANEEKSTKEEKDVVKNKGDPSILVDDVYDKVEQKNGKKEIKEETKEVVTRAKVKIDTTETSISQTYGLKNDDGTPIDTYYTNEEMLHNVNLTISGNETTLYNHVVKIEMDNEFLSKHDGLVISKPELASDVSIVNEGDKRVAYITFPQLSGGTVISFPVKTKFVNTSYEMHRRGTVPEGYELKIGASLLDDNKKEIKESNELVFKAKYDHPEVTKRINGDYQNGRKIPIRLTDAEGNIVEDYSNQPIKFTFSTDINMSSGKYRKYESYTVTDTLPEGAVFDPDLEINGKKVNEGWKLSSDGKKVTKVGRLNDMELYLTFPNAKRGESKINNVDVVFHQSGKKDYEPIHEASDDIEFVFDGKTIGDFFKKDTRGNGEIKDEISEKKGNYYWNIHLTNPTQYNKMENVVIDEFKKEDGSFALDERMVFTGITHSGGLPEDNTKVYAYVGNNGEEIVEAQYDSSNKKYIFPENTRGYRLEISEVEVGKNIRFSAVSTIADPESVKYIKGDRGNNQFWNEANFSVDFVSPENNRLSFSGKDDDYYSLVEFKQYITISKEFRGDKTYFKGDKIGVSLDLTGSYPNSQIGSERELKNFKVIDLLPDGLSVDEEDLESMRISYVGSTYVLTGAEVVDNYRNTGRTAVIIDIKGKGSKLPIIDFFATVNELSEEGKNTNDMYVTFDGGEDIELRTKTKDIYDINGNGKTDDDILHASATYNYAPVKEVVIKKYVKSKTQDAWSSVGVENNLGDTLDYKLNVTNYLDTEVRNLLVYDVLPSKDDKAIVENDEGERINRGSTFGNILTGEIEVPEGFAVYYTTDSVIEDEVKAVKELDWVTSVSDYSKVTAFKIEMDDDRRLQSRESVDFFVSMKAPDSFDIKDKERAYNSAAVSVNKGVSFVEGNKVFNEMYIPSGSLKIIKEDSSSANKLEGATFEIKDSKGKIVEKATTNKSGEIIVKDLPIGKYTIKEVTPPKGYVINKNAFDVEIKENEVFTLNVKNTLIEKVDIPVTKVWKDNDSKERPEAISVDLLRDGKVLVTEKVTKDSNWKYVFKDLDKTDSNGKAYEYTVKEHAVEGYDSTVDGYNITNLRVGKIDVPVTKVWKDNDSKERPEAITVDLLQNGEVLETVEITAENDWKHTFKGLDEFDSNGKAYEYTVKEHAVEGYETILEGNQEKGFVITNTLIINELPITPEPKEPVIEEVEKEVVEGKKLPKTATDMFNYLLIGLGFILLGVLAYFFFRKKEQKE